MHQRPAVIRKRLLIEISPHRFDAVVLRGGDIIARCDVGREYDGEDDALGQLLESAKPKLIALVASQKLKNVRASVLYSAPSTSLGIFSCPISAGTSGAIEAAALALEESADYALADNPHVTSLLCTDPQRATDNAPSAPMTHVFGMAEADTVSEQVCQWVRDCGLSVEALVPTKAVSMLAAVEAAMTPRSKYTRIVLHMSDDNAVLAAARDGSLTFVRTIGTGASAFVDAMAGDIKASGSAGAKVHLTRSQSASFLFRVGIPVTGGDIDAELGIRANDVLPLLQPILQRCVVETKQSLRFGLSRHERETALLAVTGVGGKIPGLADLIAQQAGIHLDETVVRSTGTGSSLQAYMLLKDPPQGIVSNQVQSNRQLRRLQMAMGVGVAAALLLLGADAANTQLTLKRSQQDSQAISHRMESDRPMQQASQRLAQTNGLLIKANQTFAQITQGQAKWDAVLALFSMTASEHVTFSRISMSRDEGRPLCSLTGEVRTDSEPSAREAFTTLVDALSSAPIVERCSIASTTKDRVNPGVQRFELRLTLRENTRSTIVLGDDGMLQGANGGDRR
jgi:hypothetical protein